MVRKQKNSYFFPLNSLQNWRNPDFEEIIFFTSLQSNRGFSLVWDGIGDVSYRESIVSIPNNSSLALN